MPSTDFASLNIPPALLSTVNELNYSKMTAVQAESLPSILQARDVIVQAKTGSGKTAAFGLGILTRLEVKRFRIQALVLCPTRELADQVAGEIRKLARGIHNIKVLTLCGGQPFGPQLGSLEHGAHIIVGTPGRVEEHLRKRSLNLDELNILVLDEADRMLEMGFKDSLDAIIQQTPPARQTLLFSATYPPEIDTITKRVLQQPVRITISDQHNDASIKQHFYRADSFQQRLLATRLLLLEFAPESAIVFANTKKEVQEISDELCAYGFSSTALHGDREQKEREQTLVQFANGSTNILVATDVAARGLDIEAVDLVINYHLPHDTDVHVHRVGRTGRAGRSGVACSLVSERDTQKLAFLQDQFEHVIGLEPLPPQQILGRAPAKPDMLTLQVDGGKRQKIRPGDILGALTGNNGIDGAEVGKIKITAHCAYVAVKSDSARFALQHLMAGKIKGRNCRARILRK